MTSESRKAGLVSEASIKTALTEAKGDLFLAACALGCTAREIDQYIRRSASLQAFAGAVEQVKVDPAYSRLSSDQFENQVADLVRVFRVDGIKEVHKLATMGFGDSAALAKVKLDAALALTGGGSARAGNSESENALAELNALYHANAPRIKEIRQTVITMTDDREAIPQVIEHRPGT
jgi:hypothetical protein